MANTPKVLSLRCAVQKYAWGKKGKESAVAQLKAGADSSFAVSDDTTYAELWMGTHPNGPSMVCPPGVEGEMSLEKWLERFPEQLGEGVRSQFKDALPFLFKVLSVRTALSIQAHPNKVHAEALHKNHPDIYKDPNHKPEMAIALTPFTGLCGFRPIKEVANFLQTVEEFREAVGSKASKLITASQSTDLPLQREAMKDCFNSLMETDIATIQQSLTSLVGKVENLGEEDRKAYEGSTLLKLNSEFPGDRGCFAIYFLNIVQLEPGEAMFLEANLPHAYLSGDCMECMACSDNVVRAGLTPKYIDVNTLCSMLDYTSRPVSRTKFLGLPGSSSGNINITHFNPPVPDFGVSKYEVPEGTESFELESFESASICIVIKGQGVCTSESLTSELPVCRGSVIFVACNTTVKIKTCAREGMLLFRAYSGDAF